MTTSITTASGNQIAWKREADGNGVVVYANGTPLGRLDRTPSGDWRPNPATDRPYQVPVKTVAHGVELLARQYGYVVVLAR